jgi:hypothetical protein
MSDESTGTRHHIDAFAYDYAKTKAKMNSGGNCGSCRSSKQCDTLQCTLKRNKTVNKFAVCHLFESK